MNYLVSFFVKIGVYEHTGFVRFYCDKPKSKSTEARRVVREEFKKKFPELNSLPAIYDMIISVEV